MINNSLQVRSVGGNGFMGVGAYLIGEGYPSPMFLTGVRSFTNVSDYQSVLHQSLMKDPSPQKKIGK